VDYLIARLGTEDNSSQTESKYQYQRAYALSRELKDQILVYSNSQLQQLQSSSVLVYVQFLISAFCLLTSPSQATCHRDREEHPKRRILVSRRRPGKS